MWWLEHASRPGGLAPGTTALRRSRHGLALLALSGETAASGAVSMLPVRGSCFSGQGFADSRKKTVSSILLETVMFHYRGATQIDCFSPLCSHTIICAGRITGPDPAGTYCWFGASLESPFLKCSHTAIPPPAALCNVRDSEYSSFSSVSLCFLYCTSLQSKSQSPV